MRRSLIISAILLILYALLPAQLSKELKQLENRYQRGFINEVADQLPKLKPANDDERAFVSFYAALLKKDKDEAFNLHKRLAERFPNTLHGQRALLEIAKIQILDRDFTAARNSLRQISSPELPERMYWLGLAALGLDEFSVAIANSENYLRLLPSGEYLENAHYLIVDSYIEQKKYINAINTLNKLGKNQDIDQQYLAFKLGLCYEYQENYSEALSYYRRAYELDRYSQVAYQVEEHIFAMRAKRSSLDISFLYPFIPLEIAETDSLPSIIEEKPPILPSLPFEMPQPQASTTQPLKLNAKPKTGHWLQCGRFGVESNAERRSKAIRELGIPAQYYEETQQGKKSWVVLAGTFTHKDEANQAKETLAKSDISSFTVKY
ncbi:MAG: SPOR domain-containing protein [Candidatus Cloacimonadaceae bacterium]